MILLFPDYIYYKCVCALQAVARFGSQAQNPVRGLFSVTVKCMRGFQDNTAPGHVQTLCVLWHQMSKWAGGGVIAAEPSKKNNSLQ